MEYTLKEKKKIMGNLLRKIVSMRNRDKTRKNTVISVNEDIKDKEYLAALEKQDRILEADLLSAAFDILLPVESQTVRNAILRIYSSGNVTQELYDVADELQIGTTKLQKDIDNALRYEADFSVIREYRLENKLG